MTTPQDDGGSPGRTSWRPPVPPPADRAAHRQPYGGWDRAAHGEPGWGAPGYGRPYGEQTYPPAAWPQPAVPAQPGPYGARPTAGDPYAAVPRPGGVVTAAVLGFLLGALGVLTTGVALFAGAFVSGAAGGVDVPGLSALGGAIGGVLVVLGVLALAWTVLVIWGSVWALTGRSRVLLLVGGSIALALTAIGLAGSLADTGSASAGSITWSLVLFLGSLGVVVLLSLPDAGRWFAARRASRGR